MSKNTHWFSGRFRWVKIFYFLFFMNLINLGRGGTNPPLPPPGVSPVGLSPRRVSWQVIPLLSDFGLARANLLYEYQRQSTLCTRLEGFVHPRLSLKNSRGLQDIIQISTISVLQAVVMRNAGVLCVSTLCG